MQIHNRNIEIDQFGEGEPMLLVHGLGGSGNFWWPVINAFSERFHIINPDMPGSARSDNDPNLSIESIVADMVALLDQLGIEKAHLMGHSMGTITCQHMATAIPDRIIDLALLGPIHEPPSGARSALKERAKSARENGMNGIADAIGNAALSKASKANNGNIQGFVREMIGRQSPEGYAQSCDALAMANGTDLSRVTCRSVLITGDEDGVAPAENVMAMKDKLARSAIHVLDNCGHWTPTEKPEEVNKVLRDFYQAS